MINRDLANFLIRHKQLIQESRWDELYQALSLERGYHPYELSEILIQANPRLPNDLQNIPGACFAGVDIPGNILTLSNKSIGWESFSSTNLPPQVNLIGVGSVDQEAFYRSQFDNLMIAGDTYLEEGTFKGCTVISADLSKWNTKKLAPYLFHCCRKLTTIKLPDTLNEIGRDAFQNCSLSLITTDKSSEEFYDIMGLHYLYAGCLPNVTIKCSDKIIQLPHR